MGQRMQIIISTPSEYWNSGNPNNKPRQYFIYHNQWLYGMSAIRYLKDLLYSMKLCIDATKDRDKYPVCAEDYAECGINYANYNNILAQTKTRRYYSEDKKECTPQDDTKHLLKFKNWEDLFDSLDNNNGFIFVYVNDDLTVNFDLVNGTEDAKIIKSRTPLEYLNLFYDNNTLINGTCWEAIKNIEELKKWVQIGYNSIKYPAKAKAAKK